MLTVGLVKMLKFCASSSSMSLILLSVQQIIMVLFRMCQALAYPVEARKRSYLIVQLIDLLYLHMSLHAPMVLLGLFVRADLQVI